MKCRVCAGDCRPYVDLGVQPLSNDYHHTNSGQPQYPLDVWTCVDCDLGQLTETVPPSEIFSDYLYFSSMSPSWVADRKAFAYRIINELRLDKDSLVIDIGSNDGYFLQYFAGICEVLGYEPAANVAEVAETIGVKTRVSFWGAETARGIGATLINATNVFAHTPDLDGFVAGLAGALASDGVATLEFPLFSNLIKYNQIDTIYHEHYSYVTLEAVQILAERYGLRIWRVEELATHGGSVRVFLCKENARFYPENSLVKAAATQMRPKNKPMQGQAWLIKQALRDYISRDGPVIGYGAPAKATVLCNYVGLDRDDIPYIVDDSPAKQGRLVPGTNIPIMSFEHMANQETPDAILVFAWNLLEPITGKLRQHYANAEKLPTIVTAIPELKLTRL